MWEDRAHARTSPIRTLQDIQNSPAVLTPNPSKPPPSLLAIIYLDRSLHLTQQQDLAMNKSGKRKQGAAS
jgi:hypothetical protein